MCQHCVFWFYDSASRIGDNLLKIVNQIFTTWVDVDSIMRKCAIDDIERSALRDAVPIADIKAPALQYFYVAGVR